MRVVLAVLVRGRMGLSLSGVLTLELRTFANLFTGDDPLRRHVRTRVRSPQTNGLIERFFGTLKYEHLYRGMIDDGDVLDMEMLR